MAGGLTAKQERFCQEYLVDLNAKAAAIRAGYSEKTAEQIGYQLLQKTSVQARIQELMNARAERTQITADDVLKELAKIGFSNMLDYATVTEQGDAFLDLSKITRDQGAAIQELTTDEYTEGRGEDARDVKKTKIKLADKRAALVDIGRHLKMFTDRLAHEGSVAVSFNGENQLQDED